MYINYGVFFQIVFSMEKMHHKFHTNSVIFYLKNIWLLKNPNLKLQNVSTVIKMCETE